MTPILYAKIGGIAALALALLAGGYHFGGLSADAELANYKTAVEAQHAAQLQTVASVMTQHDQQATLERAAQQKVIDAYDEQKNLAPITTGIVERVRLIEAASCSAGSRVVPSPGPVARGADAGSGVPRGDSEGDRLLQAALDAAARDSARLAAVIQFKPKAP
jgi:uncharacterized protein (DUF58 family)